MAGKKWSEEEVEFIKSNIGILNRSELADKLGRTIRAVNHVCSSLGIYEPEPQVGDKIYYLTIKRKYMLNKYDQNHTHVDCVCDCGNILHGIRLSRIVGGNTKSCGCWKKKCAKGKVGELNHNFKHGEKHTRLYQVWSAMKTRCYNQHTPYYSDYGGRGISVCDEWKNDFTVFKNWAVSNGYEDDLSIDRINNNGDYEPNNCRWATAIEQSLNRRNSIKVKIDAFGESKTPYEWIQDSRCIHKHTGTLVFRIGAGWDAEKAITKPSQRNKRKI